VRVSHFLEGVGIKLSDISARLPTTARDKFEPVAARGGQLDAKTTIAVRKVLVDHFSNEAEVWDLAAKEADRQTPRLWSDTGVPVVAYEREAVGLALQIAGLSRENVLSGWDGDAEAPFLDGITQFRVYEDPAIVYDSTVFGRWKGLGGSVIGVSRFEDRGRKVTIVNANRNPIEKTLGCDLIYYVHSYNAYVLVQYKRLTRATHGWEFRPSSDPKFDDELARMRAIAEPGRVKNDPEHYRLGENFCFIKFCVPVVSDPFGAEMARGMYVPLDYFDRLTKAKRLEGPRGGAVINFDNVGRWLNASSFVGLVERSWIGARGLTATELTRVLRQSLAAKHSLILAEGDAATPRPNRR
jgi:hypothetical protein